MENHVGVMVVCLSIDKRHVRTRFSTCKRTASISQDTCFYFDFSSNYGDLFASHSQTFLELDL